MSGARPGHSSFCLGTMTFVVCFTKHCRSADCAAAGSGSESATGTAAASGKFAQPAAAAAMYLCKRNCTKVRRCRLVGVFGPGSVHGCPNCVASDLVCAGAACDRCLGPLPVDYCAPPARVTARATAVTHCVTRRRDPHS